MGLLLIKIIDLWDCCLIEIIDCDYGLIGIIDLWIDWDYSLIGIIDLWFDWD